MGTGAKYVPRIFENQLNAGFVGWRVGDVSRLVLGGDGFHVLEDGVQDCRPVVGYAFDLLLSGFSEPCGMDGMFQSDIPTEFFNHQLADTDPASEESIYEFISCWGMPFSPAREQRVADVHLLAVPENHREAMATTDELARWASEEFAAPLEEELKDLGYVPAQGLVISLSEAELAISTLQQCVNRIVGFVSGQIGRDDDELVELIRLVNGASCKNEQIGSGLYPYLPIEGMQGLAYYGLLTSAICNQIIETVCDEAPWRECADKTCRRIFKRKQSSKRKKSKASLASIYCCDKCMERQGKENQRAAAKNRIKH